MSLVAGLLRPRLFSSKLSKLKAMEKYSGSVTTVMRVMLSRTLTWRCLTCICSPASLPSIPWGIRSTLAPSTSSCTDSLRSLTPAGRKLEKLTFPRFPYRQISAVRWCSRSGQPLLPMSVFQTMNSFGCLQWWYLEMWKALAATTDGLAATGSGLHSSLSLDCSAQTRTE